MKIGVAGLWHLGVMYAVGLAELGHDVIAYDPNPISISDFKNGQLLVFEPGLQEMLVKNSENGNLNFTDQSIDFQEIELLVLAYDTPVDEEDNADVDFVISEFEKIIDDLSVDVHVLVSSQVPVGTCDVIRVILDKSGRNGRVMIHPENLRLGKALVSFFSPDRIIVGTHNGQEDPIVIQAFMGIEAPIVWMHSKSAEVTKHALNTFLATSVTFMGELAEICEIVGADAKEVEVGLKSDARIGLNAYLSPGLGFAGGTLARDVRVLCNLQMKIRVLPAIITSLLTSNRYNNDWISRSLDKITSKKEALRICFWGVSYVENTDTLRRSEIYVLMRKLVEESAVVSYVENFPIKDGIDSRITCIDNMEKSLEAIDILVVTKKLTKFSDMRGVVILIQSEKLWVLDPSRILLSENSAISKSPRYLTVGKGV